MQLTSFSIYTNKTQYLIFSIISPPMIQHLNILSCTCGIRFNICEAGATTRGGRDLDEWKKRVRVDASKLQKIKQAVYEPSPASPMLGSQCLF